MANGWAEFIERTKGQMEAGQVDPQSFWTEFLHLLQQSPRAERILPLVEIVQKAPAHERILAALALVGLLIQLELPPEWELHRSRLLEALGELLDTMNPKSSNSLTALLAPHRIEPIFAFGILSTSVFLLRTCGRYDLPHVARLCSAGIIYSLVTYRQELQSKQIIDKSLMGALMRYSTVFERYAQAARALNSAMGEVLFEGLDTRLEIPET